MIASLLLLTLALHATPADRLAQAREALSAADYGRAEALALSAAAPPRRGEALYLVGLARFRAGRPEDALEALDDAARAEDPPERGPWLYNRGACLYALGRFAEAEPAFLAAADADPSLTAAATANAGFAALDRGAFRRARAHAEAARAVASGPALALVDDLEAALAAQAPPDLGATPRERAAAAYRDALAAFDAGRYGEARRGFRRAAELAPDDGRAPLMAGASAVRSGDRRLARAYLIRALSLHLDDPERRIALDYLAECSYGLASRPAGWTLSAHAGAGWDDNVLQSGGGSERAPASTARVRSAQVLAGAAAAFRWRPRPTLSLDVGYGLEEAAYRHPWTSSGTTPPAVAADYSLQQHVLAAAVEVSPSRRVRVGGLATVETTFTKRWGFRLLDAGGGATGWAALDATDWATSRLDLAWEYRRGPGAGRGAPEDFSYLTGNRYELGVSQQLRLGAVTLDGSFRHRIERIGLLTVTVTPSQPVAGGIASQWVLPFGSTVDTLALSARALVWRLQLVASVGYGWRTYDRDSVTSGYAVNPVMMASQYVELGRRRRHDERLSGGVAATVQLLRALSLTARWDAAVNGSNVAHGQAGHEWDYDDKNFAKHVVAVDVAVAW